MPDFQTILDGYALDEARKLAVRFRKKGYSLRAAYPDEYLSALMVSSLQAAPPTGGWHHAWIFRDPSGNQFAVFSDSSGVICKMTAIYGTDEEARSDQDELAAAVLVRMA